MKKIIAVILLTVVCVIYLFPMKFDNLLQNVELISLTQIEFWVNSNHEPHLESKIYEFGQPNEQTELLELLKRYRYRRTYKSLWTTAEMDGTGDNFFHFFIYQKDDARLQYKHTISISDTGQIVVDDHPYRLIGDSKKFVAEMEQLLQNHPKLKQNENEQNS